MNCPYGMIFPTRQRSAMITVWFFVDGWGNAHYGKPLFWHRTPIDTPQARCFSGKDGHGSPLEAMNGTVKEWNPFPNRHSS